METCPTCKSVIVLRATPLGAVLSCQQWCSLGPEKQAECRRLTTERSKAEAEQAKRQKAGR